MSTATEEHSEARPAQRAMEGKLTPMVRPPMADTQSWNRSPGVMGVRMPKVNETVGGYKLRSLLHTGPASQVFEAVEPISGRHFAMKVLKPEYADDSEHRRMLFHEAEIGIAMRHENVVNILKVSHDRSTPHFVMEYFPSGSLRTRLVSKDPADARFLAEHLKSICHQVAIGLAYMNESGYVHCDVKPVNVLVDAAGKAKIIDFAISKKIKSGFVARTLHRKGKPQGTPSYMSPEQIRDELLDGRADVYGYGVMLYEATTGRPPFRGNTTSDLLNKHLHAKPDPPSLYNPELTPEFSDLVVRMLAKNRDDRPANFHEVMMALKGIDLYKTVRKSG